MAQRGAQQGDARQVDRPDVFLSYNRRDAKRAAEIADALREAKFTVWFDKNIPSGSDWREEIQCKISRARCVVLYWSKRAEKSWWVAYEAFSAQQLGKLIITSFDDINVGSDSWAKDLQCTRLRKPLLRHFSKTDQWTRLCVDIEHKRKRLPRLRHGGWLGGGVVHKGGVTAVAFHPSDDNLLISSGRDGRAFLWNVEEAKPTLDLSQSQDQEDTIADATLPPTDMRFEARRPESGGPWALSRAGFSSDGRRFFLASEDGTARIFEGRGFSRLIAELAHTKAVNDGYDGKRLPGQSKFAQGVVDAAIGQGRALTLGADFACVWRLEDSAAPVGKEQLPPGARGRSVDCLHSTVADAFYLSDRSGRIHRVNRENKLTIDALPARSIPGAVMAHSSAGAGAADDGGYIASCSLSTSDRRIDVHAWREGHYERVGSINLRADFPVRALAVHPDAPVVALASGYRPALMAWDDGNRIDLVSEVGGDHVMPLQTIAISRTGKFMACGSEDGCISIWRDETPRDFSKLPV